jgi:hypothetical protein
MLRRFEIYDLAPDADEQAVGELERACRECGRYIPEVLDSAVGRNLSDAAVQLVWEHAYRSPEEYRRYMVHPYHAAVLDRYLLPDSPERVVATDTLGAGLVGYSCPTAAYRMARGVRRLVLLRAAPGLSAEDNDHLVESLELAREKVPSMTVSSAGANTLGGAWFDAVTPVGPAPRWTHLWEQGFPTLEALGEYVAGCTTWAAVERHGWEGWFGGVIERAVDVFYELVPG